MRDLPAAVVAKAREAGAQDWLDALPALVASLTERWRLRLGDAFGDATEAYVLAAVRGDGSPAVLKLHVPDRAAAASREITVLRLAAGRGCVRLLESDPEAGALLVERLGPAMSSLSLPQPQRLEILCDLAAAVWQPAAALPGGAVPVAHPAAPVAHPAAPVAHPAAPVAHPAAPNSDPARQSARHGLLTGAQKATSLAGYIRHKWNTLGKPCSPAAVEDALVAAESRRRAHDPARAVLLHGDVHQWNALRADDGFRLVDPDGLIAEPEYDLGVLMREDPAELLAGDPWDRARLLAARTGTDPRAIWEWGLVERVATGLVLTAIGVQPVAAEMLAAADAISRTGSADRRRASTRRTATPRPDPTSRK